MAFASPIHGKLFFGLDWGAQQVKSLNLDDLDGNYFRFSFNLPNGLSPTNTTGLGFAINDAGHFFVAGGQGCGIELSLTSDILANFSPPAGDTLGINARPADASYIRLIRAGIFSP